MNWKSNIISKLHLQQQIIIFAKCLKVCKWEKYYNIALGCKRVHKQRWTFFWVFKDFHGNLWVQSPTYAPYTDFSAVASLIRNRLWNMPFIYKCPVSCHASCLPWKTLKKKFGLNLIDLPNHKLVPKKDIASLPISFGMISCLFTSLSYSNTSSVLSVCVRYHAFFFGINHTITSFEDRGS